MATGVTNFYNQSYNPDTDVAGFVDTNDNNQVLIDNLRQITRQVNKINESLTLLDLALVKYRASISAEIQNRPITSKEVKESKMWYCREIENEMKVFHYHAKFCLKILCQEFCVNNCCTNI